MIKNELKVGMKKESLVADLFHEDIPDLPGISDKQQSKVTNLLRIICDKEIDQFRLLIKLGCLKTPDYKERAPIITWVVAEACGIIEATPLFKDENDKIIDNLNTLLNCDELNHHLPIIKGFNHFIKNPNREHFDFSNSSWSAFIYSLIDISYRKIFVSRNIPTEEATVSTELMKETCKLLLNKCSLGHHKDGKEKISIAEDCKRFIREASK